MLGSLGRVPVIDFVAVTLLCERSFALENNRRIPYTRRLSSACAPVHLDLAGFSWSIGLIWVREALFPRVILGYNNFNNF